MKILSNEQKLDLFFNTIKERFIISPEALYSGGLRTKKYVFSGNEAREYIKRFKEDGLVNVNADMVTLTENGRAFKGYVKGSRKSKINYYLKIFSIPALAFFIGVIADMSTIYDSIKANWPFSKEDTTKYLPPSTQLKNADTGLVQPTIDTSSKSTDTLPSTK